MPFQRRQTGLLIGLATRCAATTCSGRCFGARLASMRPRVRAISSLAGGTSLRMALPVPLETLPATVIASRGPRKAPDLAPVPLSRGGSSAGDPSLGRPRARLARHRNKGSPAIALACPKAASLSAIPTGACRGLIHRHHQLALPVVLVAAAGLVVVAASTERRSRALAYCPSSRAGYSARTRIAKSSAPAAALRQNADGPFNHSRR